MKIQMTQTARGSEDGFNIRVYRAGIVYDMADTQARSFISQKKAVSTDNRTASEQLTEIVNQLKGRKSPCN